jgi:hypothetical protein
MRSGATKTSNRCATADSSTPLEKSGGLANATARLRGKVYSHAATGQILGLAETPTGHTRVAYISRDMMRSTWGVPYSLSIRTMT